MTINYLDQSDGSVTRSVSNDVKLPSSFTFGKSAGVWNEVKLLKLLIRLYGRKTIRTTDASGMTVNYGNYWCVRNDVTLSELRVRPEWRYTIGTLLMRLERPTIGTLLMCPEWLFTIVTKLSCLEWRKIINFFFCVCNNTKLMENKRNLERVRDDEKLTRNQLNKAARSQ